MVMDRKKTDEITSGFGSHQVCGNKNNLDHVSSAIRIRRNVPQNLRSPAAKRALSAPVAHQGWLQKQGSEGLMLWKKRWFVLCEYCLFYYKGPEEEKLLGSILLPSYTITICSADEKINKKFAFKAEHANMRTYHFAADSRESMNQWINVLTLASLLQDPNPEATRMNQIKSHRPNKPSINQSEDDSDSGFHGFENRNESCLASMKSPKALETNYQMYLKNNQFPNYYPNNINDQQQFGALNYGARISKMQCNQIALPQMTRPYQNDKQYCVDNSYTHQNYHQQDLTRNNFGHPIYANASTNKRKPTLRNDAGALCYSSSSPDMNYNNAWCKAKDNVPYKQPLDEIYGCRSAQPMVRVDKLGSLNYYGSAQLPERRTPDTYGRNSNSNNQRTINIDKNRDQDYEDVYAAASHCNDQRKIDFSGYLTQSNNISVNQNQQDDVVIKAAEPPPRPHSADFLEHGVMKRSHNSTNQSDNTEIIMKRKNPPQRPKSSIDIVNPHDTVSTNDNYFYSEEYYAAQMRQRAAYLHQSPQVQLKNEAACQDVCDNTKYSFLTTEQKFPSYTQSHQFSTKPSQRNHRFNRDNINTRRSLRERNHEIMDPELINQNLPIRVPKEFQDVRSNSNNKIRGQARHPSNRRCQDQWFTRSASARFPTSNRSMYDNQENSTGLCEGERKREESMKRLLEWKQRMLQSPLTRKPSSTSSGSAVQNDLLNYNGQDAKSDVIRNSRRLCVKRDPLVRSKSTDGHRVTNVIAYDSYSSDDEGVDEKRKLPLCKATNGIKSSASLAHIELKTTYDKKLMAPLGNDSHSTTNERCTTEKSSETEVADLANIESTDKSMTSKRPKGILKTSISGSWDESSSADLTTDLAGETKSQPLKYVQWTCPASKNQNSHNEWDYELNEQDVVKEFSYQYIKPSDRCLSEEQLMMEDEDKNKVLSMIKSFEQVNTQTPLKKAIKMEKPLQVSSLNTTKAHIARLNTSMLLQQQSSDLEQSGSHSKSVKDLLANFESKSKENIDDDMMSRCVVTDAPETLHSILTHSDDSMLMRSEYAEVMKRKNELTKKRRRRKTLTIMNSYDENLMAKSKNMIDNFITRPTITAVTGKSDKTALENIYLPMNPRKAILNTDNEYDVDCHPTSMMKSLFANLSGEESSYVEMTRRGLTRSLLAPDEDDDSKLNYTNPHYELVCVADNVIEPVYMEVHNSNNEFVRNSHDYEISSDREPLAMRSELPDILNNLKSDSSDADDESYCKQLDSIGTPRHPRFSLSDTFRPASYYLSTSATHSHMPDMQHDSSDSDLVSPPPIPRSPPPIGDFAASLATSSSNQDEIKGHPEEWTRLMEKYSPAKIISALRNNQSPLDCTITRELMKLIKPLDENIYNFNSNSATTEDIENENDGEEDDCSKRRPINRQQCHALDMSDQFELQRSCQVDQQNRNEQQKKTDLSCDNSIYANNNEITTRLQPNQTFDGSNLLLQKDNKAMTKTNSVSSLPSMRVSDSLPCHHQHSQSFTGYSHYENVSPLHDVTITKSLSSSSSSLIEGDVKKDRNNEKISGDISSMVKISSPFSSPQLISRIQQQHFSNENKESLSSSIGPNVKSSYTTNLVSENAQACISEEDENIAQAQGAPYYYSDLRSQEMYQAQTGANQATGEEKSSEANDSYKAPYVVQTSHRRSRSLEGLLDDVGLENFIRHQAAVAAEAKISEQNESCNFEGDDPWEQDSLWRESLRMVSMRHAKSLDSLNNSKTDKCSITSPNKQPLDDEKSTIAIKNTQQTSADIDCEPSPKVFRELKPKENIHSNQLEAMKSTSNTNRTKTGFELDREKLRQWDLLSSACLLQEQQQRTSMEAELFGKGLSSCEPSAPVTHYLQAGTSNVGTIKSVDHNIDEWTLQPDAVYKNLM